MTQVNDTQDRTLSII